MVLLASRGTGISQARYPRIDLDDGIYMYKRVAKIPSSEAQGLVRKGGLVVRQLTTYSEPTEVILVASIPKTTYVICTSSRHVKWGASTG